MFHSLSLSAHRSVGVDRTSDAAPRTRPEATTPVCDSATRARCRIFAVVGLLAVHSLLLGWGATKHSPTIDEVGHLASGFSHWQFQNFTLYRVNPPLVRSVAAFPLLVDPPVTDWKSITDYPGSRAEFNVGEDFLNANGEESIWYLTLARWACIPFSILGGYACYCWSKALFGVAGGLLSLILWCFSPTVLANGQMITPDTGAAALAVAACYLFWRWLRSPTWWLAVCSGAVLGLAELTKTTLIVMFAVWPFLWAVVRISTVRIATDRSLLKRQARQLIVILALAVYVLNVGYLFEGTFQSLGSYRFVSRTLTEPADLAVESPAHENRFTDTWLASVPVPLPRNYVLGIDVQKRDFEEKMWSYLKGEWKLGGWWYYYCYGLLVKTPVGTLLLATCAAILALCFRAYRTEWRSELVLHALPVVILALVSSQTGFNHHFRYVLPIVPFVFISLGRLARSLSERHSIVTGLTSCGVAAAICSSLGAYPHSLSYFNGLAGGPFNGRFHLVDSNIDWGQDLLYLKKWLSEHPDAGPLQFAYFGLMDPRLAGIEFSLPPRVSAETSKARDPGPQAGWYAISATLLQGYKFPIPDGAGGKFHADEPYFTYLQELTPVGHAGYSIYIYHLDREAAVRLRRKLGYST